MVCWWFCAGWLVGSCPSHRWQSLSCNAVQLWWTKNRKPHTLHRERTLRKNGAKNWKFNLIMDHIDDKLVVREFWMYQIYWKTSRKFFLTVCLGWISIIFSPVEVIKGGGGNLEQGGLHYRSRGSRRNERRSFFSRMPLEYINPGLTVFLFLCLLTWKGECQEKKCFLIQ